MGRFKELQTVLADADDDEIARIREAASASVTDSEAPFRPDEREALLLLLALDFLDAEEAARMVASWDDVEQSDD